MRISLIAAVARNRVIGRAGDLPWRIPGDLKRFRALTMGKPLVMGRKTFESLPKALPGRTNIVVTRQPGFAADGARTAPDLEAALTMAAAIAEADGADEVMVMGGAEIYRQALPLASRFYLTDVRQPVEGDTLFPELDRAQWRESSRAPGETGDPATPPHDFVVLDRIEKSGTDVF